MDEKQIKYEKFVKDYFKGVDIKMPEGMKVRFTEDDSDDLYDGEYGEVNSSEKIYFVGSYKVGFAINVNALVEGDETMGVKARFEKDGKRYFKIPKKYAIKRASLITYFRTLVPQPEMSKIYGEIL